MSRLAETLVSLGNSVTVYTTNANGSEDLNIITQEPIQVEGVTVYYFKRWTRGHSNFSPSLLAKLKTSVNTFDVVHIQSWWNLVTMPSTLICLLAGKRPIISPRGSLTEYTIGHKYGVLKSVFHTGFGKWLLKKAVFMFTTQHEWEQAAKLIKISKYYILPNLLELGESVTAERLHEKCLRILFLGRIDPAKNLDLVFEALLSDVDFDYQWSIVGDGDPQYVDEWKNKTRSNNNIKWLGAITGEAKWQILAESDLLVLPSHTENYGNVVLESLSQGTAVLISPHVGIKEYVAANSFGFVVEDRPESWRAMFRKLALDKSPLHEIRKRAPITVQQDFESDRIAEKYINAYKDVIVNVH